MKIGMKFKKNVWEKKSLENHILSLIDQIKIKKKAFEHENWDEN